MNYHTHSFRTIQIIIYCRILLGYHHFPFKNWVILINIHAKAKDSRIDILTFSTLFVSYHKQCVHSVRTLLLWNTNRDNCQSFTSTNHHLFLKPTSSTLSHHRDVVVILITPAPPICIMLFYKIAQVLVFCARMWLTCGEWCNIFRYL